MGLPTTMVIFDGKAMGVPMRPAGSIGDRQIARVGRADEHPVVRCSCFAAAPATKKHNAVGAQKAEAVTWFGVSVELPQKSRGTKPIARDIFSQLGGRH